MASARRVRGGQPSTRSLTRELGPSLRLPWGRRSCAGHEFLQAEFGDMYVFLSRFPPRPSPTSRWHHASSLDTNATVGAGGGASSTAVAERLAASPQWAGTSVRSHASAARPRPTTTDSHARERWACDGARAFQILLATRTPLRPCTTSPALTRGTSTALTIGCRYATRPLRTRPRPLCAPRRHG